MPRTRTTRRAARTATAHVYTMVIRTDTTYDNGVIGAHDNAMLTLEERWQQQTANDHYHIYTDFVLITGAHANERAACASVAALLKDFPAPWQLLRCTKLLDARPDVNDVQDESVPPQYRGYQPEVIPLAGDWWFPPRPVPRGHTGDGDFRWCGGCGSYRCAYAP